MRKLILTLLLSGAVPAPVAGQSDPQAFWQRQMLGLSRALSDPSVNYRVQKIWFDLVQATGQMYPVVPSQQYTMGQALPNGVVLLDLSVAGDFDEEVTAFWLAHEYGHQVMGHPRLLLTQWGQFLTAMGGTAQEDAADRWAGRFLRTKGYDVEPVLSFLCELPGGGRGDSHSTGAARARNVAQAFGERTASPCDDEDDEELAAEDCEFTNDGECDEPDLCRPGTDRRDCGRRASRRESAPAAASFCYTNAGSCRLMNRVAVGASCVCVTNWGNYPGIAGN